MFHLIKVKFSAPITKPKLKEIQVNEENKPDDTSLLPSRKSAPAKEKTSLEKIEINEQMLKTLSKDERDRLFESLATLKTKLKEIDEHEAKVLPFRSVSSSLGRQSSLSANASRYKTITRDLKPRSATSMNVDKWIEVSFQSFVFLNYKTA